jgi:hypothetical protein
MFTVRSPHGLLVVLIGILNFTPFSVIYIIFNIIVVKTVAVLNEFQGEEGTKYFSHKMQSLKLVVVKKNNLVNLKMYFM